MSEYSKFFHNNNWDFKDDIILAPMVKLGTLPMRLLSLKYGATMVYSPEYIDQCILKCIRIVTDDNIIRYIAPSGSEIFSTIKNEPINFQLGTSNNVLALKSAEMVYDDVKGIDINMGCPLPYSTKGGMGAALLQKPEIIEDILKTLKRNINKPITCKIRLLDDINDTLKLVKIIESCNINAVAIHSRYVRDRSKRERARHDQAKIVIDTLSIPTIINGDIYSLDDAITIKNTTGANSVMIARGAQYNPSIFSTDGFIPVYDVAKEYLNIAEKVSNPIKNTTHVLKSMVGHLLKDNYKLELLTKSSNINELNNHLDSFKTYKNIGLDYNHPIKNYII